MAWFLLFCIVLADLWMLGLMQAPVQSPAPSSVGIIGGSPGIRRIARHHSDKSVAGGDVILGGFLTALVAGVLCYIRVTRRNRQNHA